MSIYLIRHGLSEGNLAGYFQGSIDTDLTSHGVRQAVAIGRWLAMQGVEPDIIYTSPLTRAARTADVVAEQVYRGEWQPALPRCEAGACNPAAGADKRRRVVKEPLIREYRAGEVEGLSKDEIAAKFPQWETRPLEARGCFKQYGGESYEEVQARIGEFTARIHREHARDEVIVVAHGGTMYQLFKQWCGWPAPRHFFTRMSNCCCFKLELRTIQELDVAELQWMVTLDLIAPDLVGIPQELERGSDT
jgi:broad specificity phosphatase PhoE